MYHSISEICFICYKSIEIWKNTNFYQENKKKKEIKVFLNLSVSEIKILNFYEFENNIIM